MSSQLVPPVAVEQATQVAPQSPQVWLPTPAHCPALQHDIWQVPSPVPPQLPLHMPLAPQVGVCPPQGAHRPPQWLLSKATHVSALQQPPLQVCPNPHADPHVLFPWHAVGDGQSVELLQPQAPLMHAAPLPDVAQSTQ